MIYIICIVNFFLWIVSAVLVTRSYSFSFITIGWVVGHFIYIIVPTIITVIGGGYQTVDYTTMNGDWGKIDLERDGDWFAVVSVMFIEIIISIVVITCSRLYRTRNAKQTKFLSVEKIRGLPSILVKLVIFQSIYWVWIISQSGGIIKFLDLNWYYRGNNIYDSFGDGYTLIQKIFDANMVLIVCVVSLIINRMLVYRDMVQFAFLGGLVLLINLILSGNRIHIGLVVFFVLTMLFVDRRFGKMVCACLILPVASSVSSLWATVRSDLGAIIEDPMLLVDGSLNLSKSFSDMAMSVVEGANFLVLVGIFKSYGVSNEFIKGESYTKIFTFIIPRSIYKNKIDNFTIIAGDVLSPGDNLSLNSTYLGEMYANLGVFTYAFAPIITFVIMRFDSNGAIKRKGRLVQVVDVVFFFSMLVLIRAVFSDSVIQIILIIIILKWIDDEKSTLDSTVLG